MPGPKLAEGLKFDGPVGLQLKPKETGNYPPAIQAEYKAVAKKAEKSNIGRVQVADIAWPENQISPTAFFGNLGKVYESITGAFANDNWIDDAKALAAKINGGVVPAKTAGHSHRRRSLNFFSRQA